MISSLFLLFVTLYGITLIIRSMEAIKMFIIPIQPKKKTQVAAYYLFDVVTVVVVIIYIAMALTLYRKVSKNDEGR